MSALCSNVATGPAFLGSLLQTLDCRSIMIAERSFSFIGAEGGPGAAILLASVTLAIAFVGYRLMFGPRLDLGDGAALAVKVGIALTLVTAWPTVSRVIALPIMKGPAELSAWSAPNLVNRLVYIDGGIVAATTWGTGRNDIRSPRTADGEFSANAAAGVPMADALAYSGARLSYLLTSIAGIGFLQLATAVLIGLAPIFASLLLFERTMGIFAGWVRTLFALLVAGTCARIILALETGILEPWLAELIRQRQSLLAAPSAALELLAMTLAFGLITAAIITLVVRLCLSLELPVLRLGLPEALARKSERTELRQSRVVLSMQDLVPPDRAVRTVAGLERLDAWRESTRVIQSRQPGGSNASRNFFPDASRTTSASRSGRPTMMGRRRDRKA